jgi:hypothetical protein
VSRQSPRKGVKDEKKTTAAGRSCHCRADRRWRFVQLCRKRQDRAEGVVVVARDAAAEGVLAVEGVVVGAGDAAAEGVLAVEGVVVVAGDAALEGLLAVEGVVVGAGDAAAEGVVAVNGSSPT